MKIVLYKINYNIIVNIELATTYKEDREGLA